jgi:hypothetical protein
MSQVGRFEMTKSDTETFSSRVFIAGNHEQYVLEAKHPFMTPTVYINFATGEKGSTVIFGTDMVSPAIRVAMSLMAKKNMQVRCYFPSKDVSLNLENPWLARIQEITHQIQGPSARETIKTTIYL